KYFEDLPGIIQAKAVKQQKQPQLIFVKSLKYALPALALICVIAYFGGFFSVETAEPQELLAEVSTNDLIDYLESTDITSDEILENIDLESLDLEFGTESQITDDLNEEDLELLFEEYIIEEEIL
ncbi:hypothetical protein, partial [Fulvivirga aurantia]|uniref:hypothetical protein n=1 Tax=Fulvivirga aurantia TaxID=2529383 RepID=UPI0016265754